VVATTPPARTWQAPARKADWLGPLRHRGLVVLLTSLVGVGVAIGTLNVLAVSYAEVHRLPGGAATLLALNALGALIGALTYGAVPWNATPQRRLLVLLGGLAAGYALLCTLPAPVLMGGVMVVTGLFLAPVLTVVFVMVGDLAPAGTVTEAFAWLVTLFVSGSAAGSAVTGSAIEYVGRSWAAGCGVLGVAACVVVQLAGRRHLSPSVAQSTTTRTEAPV
jgi:predicted MFS family arabinose efflux permease